MSFRPPPSLPNPGLERRLARAHGCPPDCPDCAAAQALIGVPDPVHGWEPFIRGEMALRVARLTLRTGRPFPILSPDEVTQFCIEEAAVERAHLTDRANEHRRELDEMAGLGGGNPAPAPTSPEHAQALAKAAQFAKSGVAPDPI